MAVPVAAIASKVVKKITFDVLTDPEKGVKYVAFAICGLMSLILIFALPVILLVSIPLLLLNSFGTPAVDATLQNMQLEKLAIYQNMPTVENEKLKQWFEQKKSDYSYCDDLNTSFDFDISWQALMAIDSVRNKQDYNNVTKSSVESLADKFVIKDAHTEKYTVTRHYTDAEGNPHTRTITKTRGIISVKTKSIETVINEMGFSDSEKQQIMIMYNSVKGVDLEGNLNIYDDIDLSKLTEYPPGNANIPYYNQGDSRWANVHYGQTGTIITSGCGPTSLAMVIAGLTGNSDITPVTIANYSVNNGYRIEGQGTAWGLMTEGAQSYGLSVQQISRKDPISIVQALSSGQPVIASMGPGHFTNGGHFIVLRGIDSDGNILVYDPASVNRSNVAWSLAVIMNESSTLGGENGSPFWTYTK